MTGPLDESGHPAEIRTDNPGLWWSRGLDAISARHDAEPPSAEHRNELARPHRRRRDRGALVAEATAADHDIAAMRGTVLALVTEALSRPTLTAAEQVVEARAILSAAHDVEVTRWLEGR